MLILLSTVTGGVLISAFASLLCFPKRTCGITAEIKKYKSIIQKKKKKPDKIELLGKDTLNTIEVLISKALIDSYISHYEFASVNNVLRKYNEMKKEIKNPEISVEYIIQKQWKRIASVAKNILQTKIQVLEKLNQID